MDNIEGAIYVGWIFISIILAIIVASKSLSGKTIYTTGPGATFNLWWKYFVFYLVAIFWGGIFLFSWIIDFITSYWKLIFGVILGIAGIVVLGSISDDNDSSDERKKSIAEKKKYLGIGMLIIAAGLSISNFMGGASSTKEPPKTTVYNESVQQQNTPPNTTNSNMPQSTTHNTAQSQNPTPTESATSNRTQNDLGTANNQQKPPRKKHALMLGEIGLGDSKDTVQSILGNPTKQENKDSGKIYYYYPSMEIHFYNDKVTTIISESPSVATPFGIHEGSTLSEVLNTYGNGYTKSQYGGLDLYEYNASTKDGRYSCILRFAVNQSDNRVNYISMRPKS